MSGEWDPADYAYRVLCQHVRKIKKPYALVSEPPCSILFEYDLPDFRIVDVDLRPPDKLPEDRIIMKTQEVTEEELLLEEEFRKRW